MLLVPFPVDIRCRPLHSQHALAGTSHANSQILTAGNPARRIAASLLDRIPLLWATSVLCGVMRCDPAYSRTHPPSPGNRAHTTRSLETAAGENRNGRKQYRRVYDSQSTTVRFAGAGTSTHGGTGYAHPQSRTAQKHRWPHEPYLPRGSHETTTEKLKTI